MKKTLENLTKAFIGESQARNRYNYYAKIAKKEGYEQISEIFKLTEDNERIHAKRLFEHIQELKEESSDEIKVEATAPTIYGATAENLKAAIAGEHYENTEMYPEFAKIAEKEGFTKIAKRLKSISKAEEHHEERYKKLLKELEAGTIFKKDKEVTWMCRECGYIHNGLKPPEKCPACNHARAYYQLKCEEY
jgi:rubrerythrin|tara:strand:+ start:751 stop:1326 length:576 start_codon:yes stop_codon:yes gene_type:complete